MYKNAIALFTALLFALATARAADPAPATTEGKITGTPGSPSATVTIDGRQLPPPPVKFGGVIKDDAKDSKPF